MQRVFLSFKIFCIYYSEIKFLLVYQNHEIIRNGQLLKLLSQSTRKKSPALMGALDSSLELLHTPALKLLARFAQIRQEFRNAYYNI